ncbi:MAG TPA: hypothetical protein V6D07_18765 [Trichocoleus sp.]
MADLLVLFIWLSESGEVKQSELFDKLTEDRVPIEFASSPARLFILLAYLQLACRDPRTNPDLNLLVRQFCDNIIKAIASRYPEAEEIMQGAWNPENDFSKSEMDILESSGRPLEAYEIVPPEPMPVFTHVCYTLSERGENEGRMPLILFERPKDWGHPRWNYHFCSIAREIDGVQHINCCHVWQEGKRSQAEAFQAIAPYLFQQYFPSHPSELCDCTHLAPDDIWMEDWGPKPPLFKEGYDSFWT